MISTVIALPYELARLPLTVLDGWSDNLPEASRPKLTLDKVMGLSDKFAGALLRNDDIAQRGADRLERSGKLLAANRLEQQAATQREQARETAATGRRQAAQQRTTARRKVTSGLQEAAAAEAQGQREAKTRAAKAATAKKAAADKRAAARDRTVELTRSRADAAAAAKKAAAQRAAKSDLDAARETKRAATKTRADAVRLSALTDAKTRKRKLG